MKKTTLYGVDIVLLPEDQRGPELHQQGKVIEINGTNSGMSFYKTGQDHLYEAVVKELARHTKGKPIYNMFSPHWCAHTPIDEETQRSWDRYDRQRENSLKVLEQQLENPDHNFFSVHDFLLKKMQDGRRNRGVFKPASDPFMFRAAKRAGVDMRDYETLGVLDGLVYRKREVAQGYSHDRDLTKPFCVLDPTQALDVEVRESFFPVEEIGLVWSSRVGKDFEKAIEGKVVNDSYTEALLNDKMLMYFFEELLPSSKRGLSPFFPESMLYGLGLHSQSQYAEFVDQGSGLFVKKPVQGSGGVGVEFLTSDEMLRYDRSPLLDTSRDVAESYGDLAMRLFIAVLDFSKSCVVFQRAIPSMDVVDQYSGFSGPACARAIVVNGKFIGALWRQSQEEGSITDRLTHNVRRNCAVLPVQGEDLDLVARVAEESVHQLHRSVKQMRKTSLPNIVSETANFEDNLPTVAFSVVYKHMMHAAHSQGIVFHEAIRSQARKFPKGSKSRKALKHLAKNVAKLRKYT